MVYCDLLPCQFSSAVRAPVSPGYCFIFCKKFIPVIPAPGVLGWNRVERQFSSSAEMEHFGFFPFGTIFLFIKPESIRPRIEYVPFPPQRETVSSYTV